MDGIVRDSDKPNPLQSDLSCIESTSDALTFVFTTHLPSVKCDRNVITFVIMMLIILVWTVSSGIGLHYSSPSRSVDLT